jgi:hypothetical protein
MHANASRHSALSYEHAGKLEAQLKAEVAMLLAKAEAADKADVPDGILIPEELARREQRLKKLAEARAKIEARASERFAREQAEYEDKIAAREAKAKATGKKPRGKPPAPPTAGPGPNDQINLTDEESRIMPVAGGGFEQCYNAQAVVAADSLLVVAAEVVQAANDKQQLEPMLGKLAGVFEPQAGASDVRFGGVSLYCGVPSVSRSLTECVLLPTVVAEPIVGSSTQGPAPRRSLDRPPYQLRQKSGNRLSQKRDLLQPSGF